jgi:hypothetical protein
VYWISRLLEHFGCKLCIGGHKHTYALSYPIKENYQWGVKGDNGEYTYTNSLIETKPMSSTLEDESGVEPIYKISWFVETQYDSDKSKNPYNISGSVEGPVEISSTKLPYIPNDLYNKIGANKSEDNTSYYRCCSPINTDDSKYNGFINYSMCQATGYKLKSNKELPCAYQVFSKLIPMTQHTVGDDGKITDSPSGNQLYPMFSVLEFKHDESGNISAIDVKMCRVAGIFKTDGGDSFTQTNYGKNALSIQYLIEVTEKNAHLLSVNIIPSEYMYGAWITKNEYESNALNGNNKYLYIEY